MHTNDYIVYTQQQHIKKNKFICVYCISIHTHVQDQLLIKVWVEKIIVGPYVFNTNGFECTRPNIRIFHLKIMNTLFEIDLEGVKDL